MKRFVVAGNWKMHATVEEARNIAEDLTRGIEKSLAGSGSGTPTAVDVVVCPPYTALHAVLPVIAESPIALGAQNCHHLENGPYTGDVSAAMLADAGCSWVIVGHSERRTFHHEYDELIGEKALAALTHRLTPILCVGESLQQREEGRTTSVVTSQIERFVHAAGSGALAASVIAYEPIWAIGTGRAATPEQAEEVHLTIRTMCEETYGLSPTIVYGGSVTADNATDLFACPNIDGALVGGASLKADSFLAIVRAAASA